MQKLIINGKKPSNLMIWCTMHYLSFYGFSGLPWWIISPNVIQTTIWFIIFNHSSPTCILWIYQILIIKGHCIHNLIVCPTKNEFSNIVFKKIFELLPIESSFSSHNVCNAIENVYKLKWFFLFMISILDKC